jgi:hypothetical protein
MAATRIDERLAALDAHYVSRINAAVAAGRMDLVRDLADEYGDGVRALMGTPRDPHLGPPEILEFGADRPHRRGADAPGGWRSRFWRRFWRRSGGQSRAASPPEP